MGKRQETRERIERDIVEVGRRHLITEGASGLSLRAVARDLGMVSSAIYRYVASRDDLLTLLIVDAYTDLADAVDEAREGYVQSWDVQSWDVQSWDVQSRDVQPWDARLLEMARAARRWAIAQPASWALMYGSPVPGYHAPAELTVGPGTRVVGAMFGVVAEGVAAGDVPDLGSTPALSTPTLKCTPATSEDFDGLRAEFDVAVSDATVTKCFLLWAALVGAISLEVFGQYGADTLSAPDDVFDGQIRLLIKVLAL